MKMSVGKALRILTSDNKEKKVSKETLKSVYRTLGMHIANDTKGHKQMTKEEWHEIAATATWNIEKLHLKVKCWDRHQEEKELAYKQK